MSAQQRLIDQREAAAAARVAARRRKRLLLAVLPVALVIAVVVALVVVKVSTAAGSPKSGAAASSAASSVVTDTTTVPLSALNAVGVGTASVGSASGALVSSNGAPALTLNGLPRVFYSGAEYCPFCAAERWAVVVAMARFGTWSNLSQTRSSSSDEFPNTATFSFHGASFTSSLVAFSGFELQSNQVVNGSYAPLDTLSTNDQALLTKYDGPPYFSAAGSIPFIDIGGKYLVSGAAYSPQLLAGKDQAQIAAALSDPSSAIAKAILGTANLITAAVCELTNNAPSSVCTSSGVMAAASKLPVTS